MQFFVIETLFFVPICIDLSMASLSITNMMDLREESHSSVVQSLFRNSVSCSEFRPSSAPRRENEGENVGGNEGENDRFYANDFGFLLFMTIYTCWQGAPILWMPYIHAGAGQRCVLSQQKIERKWQIKRQYWLKNFVFSCHSPHTPSMVGPNHFLAIKKEI